MVERSLWKASLGKVPRFVFVFQPSVLQIPLPPCSPPMNLLSENFLKAASLQFVPSGSFLLIVFSPASRKFLTIPQDFYRPTDNPG